MLDKKNGKTFGETNAADIFFGTPTSPSVSKEGKAEDINSEHLNEDGHTHTNAHTHVYRHRTMRRETRSRRVNLLFTPSLFSSVVERAEVMGISINELITTAVEAYLAGEK